MASNIRTDVKSMNRYINQILEDYGDLATDIVREESESLCKKAVREVKKASPKNTGKYKKGWTKKIVKTYAGAEGIVYNKTSYQLTHLLENGHKTANGGTVDGKPHIEPVNEEIQAEFLANIKKRLKK